MLLQRQLFIPNASEEGFGGEAAAGVVNGTLKGVPHQFPSPNAA